jgi:micrococcal nuclease
LTGIQSKSKVKAVSYLSDWWGLTRLGYPIEREPGQPFSQQTTKYLASLVLNKTITIREFGKDRYGRTLAEVYLEGRNINLEMVKAGLAKVYRGTPAPGQDLAPYWSAEAEARKQKKGMWVQGERYTSPRE